MELLRLNMKGFRTQRFAQVGVVMSNRKQTDGLTLGLGSTQDPFTRPIALVSATRRLNGLSDRSFRSLDGVGCRWSGGSGVRRRGTDERLRVLLLVSVGLSLLPLPYTGLGESLYLLLTRLSGEGDLGLVGLALRVLERCWGGGDLLDDTLEKDEMEETEGDLRDRRTGDREGLCYYS